MELSLDEWVERLPTDHRARRELAELKSGLQLTNKIGIADKETLLAIELEIGDGDDSGFLVKPSTLLRVFK